MRAIVGAMAIMSSLVACSGSQPSNQASGTQRPSETETEAYMRKAEADWAALPPKDQPALLRRILADDFVGVGTKGVVRNKREQIEADLQASPGPPAKLDYVRYRHFGDTVLAQGQETAPGTAGEPATTLVWTDVWMLRNRRWQIVAAQDTVRQLKK